MNIYISSCPNCILDKTFSKYFDQNGIHVKLLKRSHSYVINLEEGFKSFDSHSLVKLKVFEIKYFQKVFELTK